MRLPANKSGGKVPRLTAVTQAVAAVEHAQRISAAFDRLIAVLVERHLHPQQPLRSQGEEDHVRLNSSEESRQQRVGRYCSATRSGRQAVHQLRGDTNTRKDPKAEGGRKVRRYYFDYSTASKAISGLCARGVRAEPLGEAIMPAVFDVLLDRAWVTDRVRSYVASMSTRVRDVERERQTLQAEQGEITRRLKRIHKSSGHLDDDDLEALVADDNARLIAIRREIARLDHCNGERPPTADEAVAAVVQRLMTLPTAWRSLPSAELKNLLKAVVADLQIDLATSEVTLVLRLPTATTTTLRDEPAENSGRVNFTSAWSSLTDAAPIAIPIDEIRCKHQWSSKTYTCQRCRRAA